MSVAAIILAAGFSRRLGRPKQSLVLGGETLIERSARVAIEAGLWPVFAVVHRDAAFAHGLGQRGCRVLVNDQADEGMAASVRCGVRAAMMEPDVPGAVILTCDQVAVRPEHLRSLCASPQRICGSRYAGKTGVPAYFPAAYFAELLQLTGDAGARDLLRKAAALETEDLAFDVDTEEDLHVARRRFGPPPQL